MKKHELTEFLKRFPDNAEVMIATDSQGILPLERVREPLKTDMMLDPTDEQVVILSPFSA